MYSKDQSYHNGRRSQHSKDMSNQGYPKDQYYRDESNHKSSLKMDDEYSRSRIRNPRRDYIKEENTYPPWYRNGYSNQMDQLYDNRLPPKGYTYGLERSRYPSDYPEHERKEDLRSNFKHDQYGDPRDNMRRSHVNDNYKDSYQSDRYKEYYNYDNKNSYQNFNDKYANRGSRNEEYGSYGRNSIDNKLYNKNHGYGRRHQEYGKDPKQNDYNQRDSYDNKYNSNQLKRDGYHNSRNNDYANGLDDYKPSRRNGYEDKEGYNYNNSKRNDYNNNSYRERDNYNKQFGYDRDDKRLDRNNNSREAPKAGWASSRKRYEWNEDQSEHKRDEILEEELFGEENHVNTGINFKKYMNVKVEIKGSCPPPIKSFTNADLHSNMINNIKLAKYEEPTPVQAYTIPIVLNGQDLMACAQTGSGKTAAFLIPILSKLFKDPPVCNFDDGPEHIASQWAKYDSNPRRSYKKPTPVLLIIAPTRELSVQIFDESCRFAYLSKLRPCVVYGGSSVIDQKKELEKGCDILVGTPGRLKDFINRRCVCLKNLKYLVIDEADRMLEMGFESQLREILSGDCPKPSARQTLLFSATFPKSIRQLCKDFMKKYLFLAVGRVGGTTENIKQKVEYVEDCDKQKHLMDILMNNPPCKTLIFLETKRRADTLDDYLYNEGLPCTSIHGDRTQAEREDALVAFRNDVTPILIATSVAARGLDIKDVMHVINYDLCSTIDEYVHRIGRTARAGNIGTATSFFNRKNDLLGPGLVKLLKENKQDVPDFLKEYEKHSNDVGQNPDNDSNPDEAEWEASFTRFGERQSNNDYNNNGGYDDNKGYGDNSGYGDNKRYGDQKKGNWGSTSRINDDYGERGNGYSDHITRSSSQGNNWASAPSPSNNKTSNNHDGWDNKDQTQQNKSDNNYYSGYNDWSKNPNLNVKPEESWKASSIIKPTSVGWEPTPELNNNNDHPREWSSNQNDNYFNTQEQRKVNDTSESSWHPPRSTSMASWGPPEQFGQGKIKDYQNGVINEKAPNELLEHFNNLSLRNSSEGSKTPTLNNLNGTNPKSNSMNPLSKDLDNVHINNPSPEPKSNSSFELGPCSNC